MEIGSERCTCERQRRKEVWNKITKEEFKSNICNFTVEDDDEVKEKEGKREVYT